MKIKSIKDKNVLYLHLYGELDECSAKSLKDKIDEIFMNLSGIKQLVFNLSNLTFMDSTGIGMLLGRYKKLKALGINAYIQNASLSIERIIEISGLYKIMPKIWGKIMYNKMSVSFLSISENEAFARNVIACFLINADPTLRELNDIKTAVSEAVTNAIVHGYPNTQGSVEMTAEIIENSVHITIKDYGVGIENLSKALELFYTTKPNDERSGMGFTIMQSFMDSIDVSSSVNQGTIVKMSKKLKLKDAV